MPVVRLSFSVYQSSNENGGGNHAWSNVSGAGATAFGAGAYSVRDPNSADMNWIRSNGDGARGSASIPAGSTITGIKVGFEAYQTGGAQTGGSCVAGIFKGGSLVASKSVSMPQGASVGPFGASNDLWGLGGVVSPTYFTDMYFGLHINFPNITANINVYAWNGYMDIYYNDPTPVPASISVGAGNNQSAQINTQFGLQLYAIVRDQGGNTMPGVNVTFTLPASGASAGFNSLGGTKTATAITNASGGAVSPFFFANAVTGNWQPVADVTGSSPLVFVLFNETNDPVPPVLVPTNIFIVQGSGQQASVLTAFSVLQKVRVRDQFNAVMNNVEVQWTLPGSGARGQYAGYGVGASAVTFTDSLGVATAPVLTANNVVGAWTEPAFPTGFPAVLANFLLTNLANNAPPAATSLTVVSGSGQSTALSTNFPTAVVIGVRDQYGSAFPGASVTATIPSAANGSFLTGGGQSKTVTADASGNATFGTIVAGGTASAGWNMTVTCTGTGGTTVTGFRNIDATLATSLAIVSGSGQIATPSTGFTNPLRVRVTNGLGNGVQNVSVTFTAPGSSASCTFPGPVSAIAVLTDASGYAQTTATANANEGSYNVTVSASGLTSVTFAMQNGNTYGTEVCTAIEVTGGATNSTLTGTGPTAWTNPNSCDDAAGGATHADVTAVALTFTNMLLMLKPASWAAIPDTARISKIVLTFSKRYTGTVQTPAGVTHVYNNGSSISNQSIAAISTSFSSTTHTYTTSLGTMSGAQLKLSNSGIGIIVAGSSGTPNGEIQINGATVQVCWRPFIPPPVHAGMPPLLSSEM